MQRQPTALDYEGPRAKAPRHPWFWTRCGFIAGICAIAIWIVTFEPHGGPDLSWFLFPVARLVFGDLFPSRSIDPMVWYGSAMLQWVTFGALIDVVRWVMRRRAAAARVAA